MWIPYTRASDGGKAPICLRHHTLICTPRQFHYSDVIMGSIVSQIPSLTIVYSTVYSGSDQRKHQSSASLAFVRGIHRRPVNCPHKGPVTRKIFPFDYDIMFDERVLPSEPRCCNHDKTNLWKPRTYFAGYTLFSVLLNKGLKPWGVIALLISGTPLACVNRLNLAGLFFSWQWSLDTHVPHLPHL